MEVRCPQCTQRLRYSDVLKNPRLRCRSCGTEFQADDAAEVLPHGLVETAGDESRETADSFGQIPPLPQQQKDSRSDSSRGLTKSGVGPAAIIILLIALKVGVRLVQEFTRHRPPQQPGRKVQLDQHHQSVPSAVQKFRAADTI